MSIRSKVILSVAAMQFLTISVLIFFGISSIVNLTQENLNEEHTEYSKTIAEIATPAIIKNNKTEIDAILKKMDSHPEIQSVTVMDNINNIIYKSSKPTNQEQDLHSLTVPIFQNDKLIAFMEVETSTSFTENLLEQLLKSNITAGIISIVVTIFIAVFLGSALTRRIETIKQAATAIRAGQTGFIIPNYIEDELTAAITSINSMSSQLDMNRQELEETIVKYQKTQAKLAANEELLVKKGQISEAVSYLQSLYIDNTNRLELFDKVKTIFLNITKADHFLIGEVTTDNRLSLLALTDMSWNEETKDQFKMHQSGGEFIIDSMDNLLGQVLIQRKPIALLHPRLDKVSKGHPGVKNYLGLPIFIREKAVGIIALADHPTGFSSHLPDLLEPLTSCCGSLILAFQDKYALDEAQKAISTYKTNFYQDVIDNFPRALYILDHEFKVMRSNILAKSLIRITNKNFMISLTEDEQISFTKAHTRLQDMPLGSREYFEIHLQKSEKPTNQTMILSQFFLDEHCYYLVMTKE